MLTILNNDNWLLLEALVVRAYVSYFPARTASDGKLAGPGNAYVLYA